ncbi:MAG: response regulator [Candidatus Cyclobacteriaceae bacterium M2_1C_046]
MKKVHILLVEDNEGDIVLTTEALQEGKIANSIAVARDGSEALRYLEKKDNFAKELTPDIILLDVNLPKMNGHELLKIIKTNDSLKHIPVVMLTTSSSEADVIKSYQNYANCYITKPVDVSNFLDVVTTIEDFWISIVQLPTKIK